MIVKDLEDLIEQVRVRDILSYEPRHEVVYDMNPFDFSKRKVIGEDIMIAVSFGPKEQVVVDGEIGPKEIAGG